MNTIRLYLLIAPVWLWAAIATVQAGAVQFAGASAAAEVPATPEDGGPRNWQVTGFSSALNLREQPATASKIINTYPNGTILDNLGCQHADGRTRAIFLRMGKPIGADTSEADGYPEFGATKENDLNLIHVGNERYEIPDALVLGG